MAYSIRKDSGSQAYPGEAESAGFGKLPKGFVQISDYDLPVMDVCTQRRNFPGYQEKQFVTVEEIVKGDESGTTETDSVTDPIDPGYTRINRMGSRAQSMGGKQLSISPLGSKRI